LEERYVPNYTRWILHRERQRLREAVVRPNLEGFDADAGMADLLADVNEALLQQDPTPRYNIDENSCTLSLFRGDLGRAGAGTNVYLLHVEWHTIMMYLLLNLDETQDYQE